MRKFLFWLIVCSFPAISLGKTPVIFKGIKGEMLENVKSRLFEYSQDYPLETDSDENIKRQVLYALEPYGYFTPILEVDRSKGLLIDIQLGKPITLQNVTVQINGAGENDFGLQTCLTNLKLRTNSIFNSTQYEETKQNLIDCAQQKGYLQAKYDTSEVVIDKKNYIASIKLVLTTNQKYYFGLVQFDSVLLANKLLYRYIPFNYGAPYSAEEIAVLNNYLINSGYFKQVIIEPKISDSPYIPLQVHLKNVSRYSYSIGAGYGTDTGIRGKFGLSIVPVNNLGHKLNLAAQGSVNENIAQAQYLIPGHNPIIDQYALTTSFSNLHYSTGNANSFLAAWAWQHKLTRFQSNLSLNGLFERYHYNSTPNEQTNFLFPKLTLNWVDTTDPLFSPSGYNFTFTSLGATKVFLSEIDFIQGSIDAKMAHYLATSKSRLYFHAIFGLVGTNNIDRLPLSLAFLLGGADNLKGYSYNSLGPGKKLTYLGFELQQEVKERWFLRAFYDIGSVYDPQQAVYKKDIGLGLMWASPIGPIRIGLAQPINDPSLKKHLPKLVINMGPDL